MLQVGEGCGRIQSYRFSRIVPGMVSRNYQVDTFRRQTGGGKAKGKSKGVTGALSGRRQRGSTGQTVGCKAKGKGEAVTAAPG